MSQSYLYHAYAWLKLFNFSRSYNKNLTSSDTQVGWCSALICQALEQQQLQAQEQEQEQHWPPWLPGHRAVLGRGDK